MKIIKLCTDFVTVSAFYFYSGFALAEEFEEEPTFNYVPLLLLFVVLVVFRKKLIEEATPHLPCEEEHHAAEQPAKTSAPSPTRAKPAEIAAKARQPEQKELIDMSQNVEQCQGATAKGTRCSRTSNLETIEVTVEGKLYRFKTCRQHNNDSFKPFLS